MEKLTNCLPRFSATYVDGLDFDELTMLVKPDQSLIAPLQKNMLKEAMRRFEKAMMSASEKEYVADLTKQEACAICFFSGVPYSHDGEAIIFDPCGLIKRNGVWTAVTLT